jgi:hypothetical protein
MVKLLKPITMRAKENNPHTRKAPPRATQKFNLKRKIYATMKRQLIPPIIGTIVVASTATCVDCVQAMKKREMRMVDGKPAIKPPIFVPCFSARTVPIVIQRLPTIKERISFTTKILSISML